MNLPLGSGIWDFTDLDRKVKIWEALIPSSGDVSTILGLMVHHQFRCVLAFSKLFTDWPDWSRALNVHWKSKRPINPPPWGWLPSKSSHPDTSRPKNDIMSEAGNLWLCAFCALRPPASPSLFSFSPTLNRFSPALHRLSSSSVTSVSSAEKKSLFFLSVCLSPNRPCKNEKNWTLN